MCKDNTFHPRLSSVEAIICRPAKIFLKLTPLSVNILGGCAVVKIHSKNAFSIERNVIMIGLLFFDEEPL
jgi:hypothetical protein